jgi:hypothetical protein
MRGGDRRGEEDRQRDKEPAPWSLLVFFSHVDIFIGGCLGGCFTSNDTGRRSREERWVQGPFK